MGRRTRTVGVFPASELARRKHLFAALEQAFPVSFDSIDGDGSRGLAGAVRLVSEVEGETACPALAFLTGDGTGDEPTRAPRPRFVPGRPGSFPARSYAPSPARVELSLDDHLDARLRGRVLEELAAPPSDVLRATPGDIVLASRAGAPVWLRRRREPHPLYVAASAPAELGEREGLRDYLRAGRFLALLPLVEFLRELTRDGAWTAPPLRAAFMFDDPNLHWTSYGHIRYPELAREASKHGYHAVMATIPIDRYFVHAAAARTFKANARFLSLAVHGNDHTRDELLHPGSDDKARELATQALARVALLEKRSGLTISRVMCAPHGTANESAIRALLDARFDALCGDVAFPWSPGRPPPGWPLAGWEPAQFLGGGLPLVPRYPLAYSRDDLVFRAYLGLPLVLYGHHEDLAVGVGALADAAADVNALGRAEWSSLAEICRSNFLLRNDGDGFRVRLYSRRASVRVPRDVDEIVVEIPPVHGASEPLHAVCGEQSALLQPDVSTASSVVFRAPANGIAEIELISSRLLGGAPTPRARWRPWPLVRRGLTETRDRLRPIVTRDRPATREPREMGPFY